MAQIQNLNVDNSTYKLTASQIISDTGVPGYTTSVPTGSAATGAVAFVNGGSASPSVYSSSTNVAIGTSWTESTDSYTVAESGYYMIRAFASFSNTRPTGTIIGIKPSSNAYIQILAKTEYTDASLGSYTITGTDAEVIWYIEAGTKIIPFFKAATAGNNATWLWIKGPLSI